MRNVNNAVEVLVLSYNTASYIETTLNSLINQTCQPLITVVDDCSSDESRAILEERWADKVNLIFNDVNQGVVKTVSKWINSSNAEFLIIHGADDISPSTRVESDLLCFKNNPGARVVLSQQNNLDRIKQSEGPKIEVRFDLQDLFDLTVMTNISYMVRKDSEDYLPLDETIVSEEPQLIYEILDYYKSYGVFRNGQDGLQYRVRDNGLTATRMSGMLEEHEALLEKFRKRGYCTKKYEYLLRGHKIIVAAKQLGIPKLYMIFKLFREVPFSVLRKL